MVVWIFPRVRSVSLVMTVMARATVLKITRRGSWASMWPTT